jgi:integrase/recombinase XerD
MLLSQAIEYFNICKLADGYSPNTMEVYGWALSRLLDFAGDKTVGDITLEQLRRFMLYMKREYKPNRPGGSAAPLSPSSLENIWKAIRSFFGWAEEELSIARPDLRLAKPPNPPAEIDAFNYQEIQALVAACERDRLGRHRPTGRRDKAIVLMLLDTGLRVGELARLKIGDVQQEKVYVAPWGSGRKTRSRFVYIGRSTARAVFRYLLDRREQESLFTTKHGREMDRNNIRHMIHRLGTRAGVQNAYPHRFRHTFAIQYLRNGGDVFTLQRLLGHSTLEMVRRYLRLADRDAEEAHRLASPVDRWKL